MIAEYKNVVAFYTILRKEIRRFTRIWLQTILPTAITTALYLLIFGSLIGARVGPMQGLPYLDYIIPGVIMLSIITNSYGNVVSSFYGAKNQKYVEEMLVSPVPNWLIVAGYVTGGVVRGMTVALTVSMVAYAFSDFRIDSYLITVAVMILTATLFATAGFINAVFANSFDDVSIIPTFVLTPLTYLGGVFYSLEMLPVFWQKLSLANPVLYMVNAFRHGILGVSDINIITAFFIIIAFVVVLLCVAVSLLNRGVGIKT